jgi:hypothetical protein
VSWFEDFRWALEHHELRGWQTVFFWVVVVPPAVILASLGVWVLVTVVFWLIDLVA